ncbi:rlmN, partial [Symbiodinium necroappetens]
MRRFARCTSRVQSWHSKAARGEGKLVLELQDGQCIETVIIEHGGPKPRATVCVSSQIGCKMGCRFCATGTMGLRAQLHAGEILEQLLHAKQYASPTAPIRNVVFMGMGEPLDNYPAVLGALKALTIGSRAFGLALKNVTVSTVGVPGKIRQLAADCPAANLALSLHAPMQDLRSTIVPSATSNKLDALLREVDEYGALTGNKVMMEYILIEGVNTSAETAHALGSLLARQRALVMLNLIPYNPTASGDGNGYQAPTDAACKVFRNIVAEYRRCCDAPGSASIADAQAGAPLLCTIRWSTVPGQAQLAACGQLALESAKPATPVQLHDIEDMPLASIARKVVKQAPLPPLVDGLLWLLAAVTGTGAICWIFVRSHK